MEQSYTLETQTLSNGKRTLYLCLLALILGLAMFIAGAVMLGVGIHRHNQKVNDAVCPIQPGMSTSTASPPTTPSKTAVKDVLILLDASQDIAGGDFQTMKEYIAQKVIPALPPSSSNARAARSSIAIMSYSDEAVSIHNYYEATDTATLRKQVENIQWSTGKTNIAKGASTATQLLNSSPNVMMVMGSGNQTHVDNARASLQNLMSKSSTVAWLALGPASQIDFSSLTNDTSSVFNSANYSLPDSMTAALTGKLNPTNTTAPPVTQPPITSPLCKNDILILIDDSDATQSLIAFNNQLSFLTNVLIPSWTVGLNDIEVNVLSYSIVSGSVIGNTPFAYSNYTQVVTDIRDSKLGFEPVFGPSIVAGLSLAENNVVSARPGHGLTVLLFTYSSGRDDIYQAAPLAAAINGTVVVVGVGSSIISDYLYYLSGNVLTATIDLDASVANQVNAAVCAARIPGLPVPTEPPTSTATTQPPGSSTSPQSTATASAATTPQSTPSTAPPASTSSQPGSTTSQPSSTTSSATSPATGSTVSQSPSTTASPGGYIPCQSSIVFVQDMSLNFSSSYQNMSRDMSAKFIVQDNWNHFERVGLASYAGANSSCVFGFGSFADRNSFTAAEQGLLKFTTHNSIAAGMQVVQASFSDSAFVQNTVFYVSFTSDAADIRAAIPAANYIAMKGKLIIVAVTPPADVKDLTPLVNSNTVIIPYNLLDGLDDPATADAIRKQFVCSSATSTTVQPSTTSQTSTTAPPSPSPSTTTVPTTTMIYTTQSTTTPSQYIPCQSWISFSADVSNVLSAANFKTQIAFIQSAVGAVNHPERVQYLAGGDIIVPWENSMSIQEIQNQVGATAATSQPFSLRELLGSLYTAYTSTLPSPQPPIGAVVFISDTTTAGSIDGADSFATRLKNAGVTLTFVLLGPNVDQSKLTNLATNFITWTNLSSPQPDNWDTSVAYACNGSTTQTVPSPSTTPGVPTTTGAITVPTTTTPSQYIPCQSWISFSPDVSKVLTTPNFQTQVAFIQAAVGAVNHPERVQYIVGDDTVVEWMNSYSIPFIQGQIRLTQQDTSQAFNLRNMLATLFTAYTSTLPSPRPPIGAVVFISDTTTAGSIDGADSFATRLKNAGVTLTFVLLGPNVDQSKLTNLATNFITWTNLSSPQPDNWDTSVAYACNGATTPSTTATRPASTTTSPGATTPTPSIPSNTTSSPSPAFVCRSYIPFAYDISKKLTSDEFAAMKSFLLDPFLAQVFPQDVQPAAFGTFDSNAYGIRRQANVSDISSYVKVESQGANTESNVVAPVEYLISAGVLTYGGGLPVNTVIFAGFSLATADVNTFQNYTNILIAGGNTLTVVLVDPNVDQTNYLTIKNLNLVVWSDPSTTISNIEKNMNCLGGPTQPPQTTTTGTATTTTMSSKAPTTTGAATTTAATTSATVTSTVPPATMASSTTRTSSIPPTTTAPGNTTAFVCRSYIPFAYDVSTKLSSADFATMKSFLLDPFLTKVFPLDVEPASFATYATNAYIGRRQANVSGISSFVSVEKQSLEAFSNILRPLEALIAAGILTYPGALPVNTIVFAGASLDLSDVAFFQNVTTILTAGGNTLTVVLMSPGIDQTNFLKVNGLNLVVWTGSSATAANIEKKFNCLGGPTQQPQSSTTTVPSTVRSTTLPASSTTASATVQSTTTTTTVTSPATTSQTTTRAATTTSATVTSTVPPTTVATSTAATSSAATTTQGTTPAFVCRSYIPFAYDVSTKLTSNEFATMKMFLLDPLLTTVFPIDVEPAIFGTYATAAYIVRRQTNVTAISNYVSVEPQGTAVESNVLTPVSEFISRGVLTYGGGLPVNTIVFAGSSLDTNDVISFKNYTNILTAGGNTLTVVLMDATIDRTNYRAIPGLNLVVWSNPSTTVTEIESGMNCANGPTQTPQTTTTGAATTTTMSSKAPTTTGAATTTGATTSATVTSTVPPTTVASSTAATTTQGTTPAFVCRSYIPFAYDRSTKLSVAEFATMKTFLLDPFLASVFPLDVQPAAFGTYDSNAFVIRRQANITGISSYVKVEPQGTSLESNVVAPVESLISAGVLTYGGGLPVNTVIFAGFSLATADVNTFQNYTNILIAGGNTLTVVLVDPNVDQTNYLTIKNLNLVVWSDPSTTISNIEKNMNCLGGPTQPTQSSQVSSSAATTTLASTTVATAATSNSSGFTFPMTTTPTQYLPCNAWISFSADTTNTLSAANFQTQISFISTAIGQINHPERLQYITTTSIPEVWKNIDSIPAIQNTVMSSTQSTISYSLRSALATAYGQLSVPPSNGKTSFIIFVSDTSTEESVGGGVEFATDITNSGASLWFVLMGPSVDRSKLSNYTTVQFLTWSNLNNLQPDSWNDVYFQVYNCNGTGPATVPTTSSAASTQPTSTTAAATTSTPVATTSTSPNPASSTSTGAITISACQSHIPFAFDVSTGLKPEQFVAQRDMIVSPFLRQVFDPALKPSPLYTFDTSYYGMRPQSNVSAVIDYVKVVSQGTNPTADIMGLLRYLNVTLTKPDNMVMNLVIFTGATITTDQVEECTNLAKNSVADAIFIVFTKPNVNSAPLAQIDKINLVQYDANPQKMISDLRNNMKCLLM